jgi:PmbA protein
MTDYLALAKDIVARAAATGVEAEVLITNSKETTIRVDRQQVEQLSQSGSRGYGVRVIDAGRVGYAYSSDFSPEGIEKTWRAAVELASVATPDELRSLPEPQPIPDEDLEIFDPTIETMPVSEKIEFLKRVERGLLEYDPRVVMAQMCNYQDSVAHVYMANSRGFASSYGKTTVASFLFGIAKGDDGMTSGLGVGVEIFFNALNPEEIGREAGRHAVEVIGGKSVPTQKCTVIFDALVAGQILAAVAEALTADSHQRGRSFLIGKQGQEIGSDKVSLMDNGRLKRALGTSPFDGEGVPTSATRLIDEGVFVNVIHDSYTAKRGGAQSTGNAQRQSHRALPSLGMNNFYMQPGNETPAEIIAGTERGLLVTNIMQTGGIDPATGDCSMAANGLWIENGKVSHPVIGVTVATTLPELLKSVVSVGSDLRWVPFGGLVGAPTIRVENVTVAGA